MSRRTTLAVGLVAVISLMIPSAWAHKNNTQSAISFDPGSPVAAGTMVDITATVTFDGTTGSGSATGHTGGGANGTPVVGDNVKIQQLQLAGAPVNCGTAGAAFVDLAEGATDGTGQFTHSFDTTGLAGQTIGFRAHHPDSGGAHGNDTSTSPCLPLVITALDCDGLEIGNDFASGNGTPAPGESGPWQFQITVQNCTGMNLTGVKVQGGSNGWAPVPQPYAYNIDASTGSFSVRSNNRNQVITWTLDIADGETETLLVRVNGTVPLDAICGEIRFLSGAWSAVYDDDGDALTPPVKTDYTERVSVTVTCL